MQFFSSDFSYLVENETEEGGQCHVNTALSLLSLSLSLPHLPPSLYKKKNNMDNMFCIFYSEERGW